MSIKLLKFLHLYDEQRVAFYINNAILSFDGNCLYLKECFRNLIELRIPDNVRIKLHRACIDLYNTQLPLKPSERDLMLSRQTMRREIEYHEMFLPFTPALHKDPVEDEISKPALPAQKDSIPVNFDTEKSVSSNVSTETKEEKINKISFIIEDEAILDGIVDSIKDYVDNRVENSKIEQASNSMSLSKIINAAGEQEKNYNYKRAVLLYQQALTKTKDEDFYTFLPIIYLKLAQNYKNMSDWYEALEYYTQAQDFYVNVSNYAKVTEIKLEIANIYYSMYKPENAKFILEDLQKQSDLPNELLIKINLTSAKICDNSDMEYEYYKKSIPLVTTEVNKSIVAELYYKYAIACDDRDDIKSAVKYYKKCIDMPTNNQYISKAMTNLAQLYDEAGAEEFAIKYYNESIEIDTRNKNFNGLYYSYLRLAEIYTNTDKSTAIEYFNKAIEYADKTSDEFCIATAYIEAGDFYFNIKQYEFAYEKYAHIRSLPLSNENKNKLTERINAVKSKVSTEKYKELSDKYDK